jgi:hypothetical protein
LRNRFIEEEEIVVTPEGKPKTIIKGVSEEDFEDCLLEYNPGFLSSLEKARKEYLKFGGLRIDEYLGKRRT